jgi:hypothetical protein
VPKEKLSALLDSSFKAFNGAGYDLGSLLDSASRIAADSSATAEHTRDLVVDGTPMLDAQAQSGDALRSWAHSLAAVTDEVVNHDPDLRTILNTGPGMADEVSRLLSQLKPTLPVLLANLTTVGQIGVTYNASLRQLLVLLPPYVAGFGSLSQLNNPVGLSMGGFTLMAGDPAPCTVGFLPPSAWRSPVDETVIDTPDNLYCKLPQDSPVAVRGVRNNPCMGQPGKRAPSVEICESDRPYEPLAMRQHVIGPYPIDPNLVSQGVLPDSRTAPGANIFGPLQGTPPPSDPVLPPPAAPSQTPAEMAPPDASSGGAPAAPSAYTTGSSNGEIAAAAVHYDPETGRYVGSDNRIYQQTDLKNASQPEKWTDLLPH